MSIERTSGRADVEYRSCAKCTSTQSRLVLLDLLCLCILLTSSHVEKVAPLTRNREWKPTKRMKRTCKASKIN